MSELIKAGPTDRVEPEYAPIPYKSKVFNELMDIVLKACGDNHIQGLIQYAQSLGMDEITARRSTNEGLLFFIAQKLGKI